MSKLWDKGYSVKKIVEDFTVGGDRYLDTYLAKYDVIGSLAHAEMLCEIGILTKEDFQKVETELKNILKDIELKGFSIEESFEDVHSKIEYILTERIGEAGKKIHTARSRNDQVLIDIHLFAKAEIVEIKDLVRHLFNCLIRLSEENKENLMPGYTHFQVAMPSSFGMWFAAYAESLIDDIIMLNAAFDVANQNPLGSAAGYGSSFPINRTKTTELMGLATLKYNSVAAQMSRGKLEKLVGYAISSVATTLNKMAMDVCLYNSQNFAFVSFPDELTTGSSIMPHKKNPDVFELIRAKCNKIQAMPIEIALITTNLPSGYHRDFQIIKESLIPTIKTIKDCLILAEYMLSNIKINKIDLTDPKYKYMFSVEAVNDLVVDGLPFREAYKKVGMDIQKGTFEYNYHQLKHTHEGSIGNLCNKEICKKFENHFNNKNINK